MNNSGYNISARNLKNGVFTVHHKPGSRRNSSFLMISKDNSRDTYYMYLNVEVEGKSGTNHYPDISVFTSNVRSTLPDEIPFVSGSEKLLCICECKKVSRLSLANAREFIGYRTELRKTFRLPESEKHIRYAIYTTGHTPNSIHRIADKYDFDVNLIPDAKSNQNPSDE